MLMENERLTVDRVDELVRLVFEELKQQGGRARPKQLLAAVGARASLTKYEQQRTETGAVRWDTHVRFYTTDCVKAGYLVKANGYWNLTPQGEAALALPKGQLVRSAQKM